MGESMIWAVVQALIVAITAALLLYGLKLQRATARAQRESGEAAREAARLSLQAAEAQRQSAQSAQAAIEAAIRVQQLAARPVLKVAAVVRGLVADVGRSPVVFALCVQNIGHGTAVIETVRLFVRGEPALEYGSAAPLPAQEGARLFDEQVFSRAIGTSVAALSGQLTVVPLTDATRAIEAAGSMDLIRVQVFAHNADVVERGWETLSALLAYRALDGQVYESAEQFRTL